MIKVGIVGGTGYAGQELVRILIHHPYVELKYIASHSHVGALYCDNYLNYYNHLDLKCVTFNPEQWASELDVIFFALPHHHSSQLISKRLLDQVIIIDLGADFRMKDIKTYEQWYGSGHGHPELISQAVYGLTELFRKDIQSARLIANPGCYTTCSILTLAPLLANDLISPENIIIDAKSGISGAGRSLSLTTHYTEINENIKSYNIGQHRHTPEIEENLSVFSNTPIHLTFTPHLVPMNRGILTTIYCKPKKEVSLSTLRQCYVNHYQDEAFIRLLPEGIPAETRWVKGTNLIDINCFYNHETHQIVLTSALDNLVKGASGQAVQNMNAIHSIKETTGLDFISPFPI